MVWSILCGLAFSAVGLVPPLIIRELIQLLEDKALNGKVLAGMVASLVVLYLLRGIFRFGYGYFSHVAAYRTLHELLCQTFTHLQNLPPGYHISMRTGEVMSQTVNDVEVVEDFIAHGIPETILALVIPATMMSILFIINPALALVVLLPIPVALAVVYIVVTRLSSRWMKVRGRRGELLAEILDRVEGYRVVKSFVREDQEANKVRKHSERYRDTIVDAHRWSLVPSGLVETTSGLGYVLVIGYGGALAMDLELNVADLVVFIVYMGQIFMPLLRLATLSEQLHKASAAAERVFELLDAPAEIDSAPQPPQGELNWNIELENVTFGYDPELPILSEVSFHARKGEVVALVGPTGAGKTTACNLVPRFYDVQHGSVRVAGYDVRQLPLSFLREHVAHVMQDVFLFHASVRENIIFGRPDATEEEIRQAARDANADGFIQSLPQGYDTIVGDRGERLSGGEKQRVSIARALLKNAPILILDEATSSVDVESEMEIQEAVSRLTSGRTVLVIAHRLSTIRNADRIVVFRDGRLIENGSHDELMELDGQYARMVHAQESARDWQVRAV